jgi:hypothetical protein
MGQRENVYEMIAMYLTALPVPPLPVWVRMKGVDEENTEEEKEGYTSSHDLLAGLLLGAMYRNRADLNRERMQRQEAALSEFAGKLNAQLAGRAPEVSVAQALFEACVAFTGGFVMAFCDTHETTPQVRFGEMDDVAPSDRIHSACVHWMVAQDILHEPDPTRRRAASHFASRTYEALLTEWATTSDGRSSSVRAVGETVGAAASIINSDAAHGTDLERA